MAVFGSFGMSEGLIGTWWYPLTRSILEKTVQPFKCADMSCMLGGGYLSGVVCMLRRRWSPQGRQEPSFLAPCATAMPKGSLTCE